jgi:general secretion pathway protein D
VVNAVRNVLEVQRIQPLPSQNAIVVRGTPSQLALVQKIIDDFDKVKPEVVVDIVVAQVRRDKVRQTGILPPQTFSAALQGNNPSSNSNNNNNNNNGLNFNDLQHLKSTNYAASISPLQAELLLTDANTKILEKPQLRAIDGIKASLKIGDRIPIATGSFGTPVGLGNGSQLGVNTQFQYQDVGVKIEITPRVQDDSDVSLKVSLEISSKTGDQPIGGINQPIISQRTVDHEIQLRDGEVNLLGGILEEQTTLNTNGVPILSRIPLLKYIFGQEDKEKHTNEIVFLLVPHIVRGRVLSALNRKRLDVGSGSNPELRFPEQSPGSPDNQAGHGCKTPLSASPSPASQPQPTPAPFAQPFL